MRTLILVCSILFAVDTGLSMDKVQYKTTGKVYVVAESSGVGKIWRTVAEQKGLKILNYKRSNDSRKCYLLMDVENKKQVIIVNEVDYITNFVTADKGYPVLPGSENEQKQTFTYEMFMQLKDGMLWLSTIDILHDRGKLISESQIGDVDT